MVGWGGGEGREKLGIKPKLSFSVAPGCLAELGKNMKKIWVERIKQIYFDKIGTISNTNTSLVAKAQSLTNIITTVAN